MNEFFATPNAIQQTKIDEINKIKESIDEYLEEHLPEYTAELKDKGLNDEQIKEVLERAKQATKETALNKFNEEIRKIEKPYNSSKGPC